MYRIRDDGAAAHGVVDEDPEEGANRREEHGAVDRGDGLRAVVERVYSQLHDDFDRPEGDGADNADYGIHCDAAGEGR